jgi:hypothetical protein
VTRVSPPIGDNPSSGVVTCSVLGRQPHPQDPASHPSTRDPGEPERLRLREPSTEASNGVALPIIGECRWIQLRVGPSVLSVRRERHFRAAVGMFLVLVVLQVVAGTQRDQTRP